MTTTLQKLSLTALGSRRCLCERGTYSRWTIQRRSLNAKRLKKKQLREETIFQHAGERSVPAERVYVWGNATTGALGKVQTYKQEGVSSGSFYLFPNLNIYCWYSNEQCQ